VICDESNTRRDKMNLGLIYEAELAGAQNKVTPKTADRKQHIEAMPKSYEHPRRRRRPTNPRRLEVWQEADIRVPLQFYCSHARGLKLSSQSNVPLISNE